jgi:hypothetical protein
MYSQQTPRTGSWLSDDWLMVLRGLHLAEAEITLLTTHSHRESPYRADRSASRFFTPATPHTSN